MKGGFSFIWVIAILFSANESICQTSTGDFDFSDYNQLLAAKDAEQRGEFENAIQFYNQYIDNFSLENDTLAYVYTLGQIGYCFRRMGDFENARDYLNRSEAEGIRLLGPDHPQMGLIYYHWGYFHYSNKNIKQDSALYFMQKSIEVRENALPPNHLDLAQSYHGLGSMYMFLFNNYYNASTYYLKAVKIKEISNPESTNLAYSYNYLGQVLYELNDPHAALPYLKTAYRIYSAFPEYDPSFMERVVNNLGNVYYYLENYSQAAFYYRKSINLNKEISDDPAEILIPLNNLATAYVDAGIYDLAQNALYQSMLINISNGIIIDSIQQSFIYANLGTMHASRNNEDSALYFFRNSIIVNSYPEGDKPLISNSYNSIGELYFEKNMFDESLRNFQSAIETLEGTLSNEGNTLVNPNPQRISYPVDVYDPLAGKARVYFKQYQTTGNNNSLTRAIQQYKYLSLLSNRIKTSDQLSDETKLEFASLASNNGMNALECLIEARNQELYPTEEIEQDVLKIMEENRYFQLLSNRISAKNSKNLDVPDSLLHQEKLLTEHITNFQLKINSTNDTLERDQIEIQQFASIRKLDGLREFIKENHPHYYQKNNSFVALQEIQQVLGPTQQVIEYFWTDSTLYALAIGSEEVEFHSLPVDSILIDQIKQMREMQANYAQHIETEFESYQGPAFNIYNRLLAPLLFEKKSKLIISTDGPLNFIPFEALISDELGSGYRDASYVLNKYDIQYIYSSSLLVVNNKRKEVSTPSVLAMSYSEATTNSLITNRNDPADIPASAIEVKKISELFGKSNNRYFTGMNASKEKFKNEVSNYQILHLAIHGYSDSAVAINSHLQFRTGPDDDDDGKLYAHELYGLNLEKLRLAVLSACETGLGKQYRGEGVFSMARGFAYAGCPTTIMSLWQTDDAQTAELMQSFYVYLNKGEEVSVALRNAKLEYIQNHDARFSNPYFWAGFVTMGNDEPIIKKPDNTILFLVIAGIILILVIIVLYKRKKYA